MSGPSILFRGAARPRPPARHADQSGSLSEEQAADLRARALKIIAEWRDADQPPPYVPTAVELREMINFIFGRDIPAAYLPMVLEDMSFEGKDAPIFQWSKDVSGER